MATAANMPSCSARFARRLAAVLIICACTALWVMDVAAQALVPYQVEAGEIRSPLADTGDAARGRVVVLSRESGNCFLCHAFPAAGDSPLGNIGPPMSGVGARLSTGQLRLRVVDSARVSPHSVMPAYYRVEGLQHVAAAYRGRPLLTAQQLEDVVAYLAQLRD
jgi:sulfur-oxidizing protein SoxX